MKNLITLLLAYGLASFGQAQSNLFYYSFGDQIALSPVDNEFTIEFLGSDNQAYLNANSLQSSRIRSKVYEVTASLNAVGTAATGMYKYNPVYQLADGTKVHMLNRVVLQWKGGVSQSTKNSMLSQYGLTLSKSTRLYELYEANSPVSTSKLIYLSGHVTYCTPEFIAPVERFDHIPNDEYFGQQFYLHNTGQQCNDGLFGTPDADIDAPEAWDITIGDPSVIIAVVDEGVTSNHPDLPNSRQLRLPGSNFAAQYDGSDADDPSPTLGAFPPEGHGDACAGLVGAEMDNNEGVVGVAPGCTVMPVKIRYGGLLAWQDFADAITFASDHGARVISCSWGGGTVAQPPVVIAIQDALDHGSVVIFAPGNSADHVHGSIGSAEFPANANIPLLLSIAASDRNDMQANYSPSATSIDLAAPSHTAYSCNIYTEGLNIWTMDIPGGDGYNPHQDIPWDDCDGPPDWNLIEQLPSSGTNYLSYTGRMGGTSASAPEVAGIAALMLSVNPCLSVQQVHDILRSTAEHVGPYDYQWNSADPGHSKELGHGRANAFHAVQTAQAMYNVGVDLYTKDVPDDFGIEPDVVAPYLWISDDIWIRALQDDQPQHESPEWTSGVPVYVYVRVRNKGCVATIGHNELLKLYWAKAATALTWPEYWDGSITTPQLMGEPIGIAPIPALAPGEETMIAFEWYRPNPDTYTGINDEPWHFCLLSRIVATSDPMNNELQTGTWNLGFNVEHNNNIAWKNISIVNVIPGIAGGGWNDDKVVGATVAIGNATSSPGKFCMELTNPAEYSGKAITDAAEVRVTLDPLTWQKWEQGGYQGENIRVYRDERYQLLITGSPAYIKNLAFEPHERGLMDVSFNFLVKELSGKPEFMYHVIQRDEQCNQALGGEQYTIRIPTRDVFEADAGNDKEVTKDEAVQLHAKDIQESAIYNWYDPSGELVYTGKDLTVTADISKKYKLEIIAEADGLKDYDEVEVKIKSASLTGISPNPSSNFITVSYTPQQATSAYLLVNMPFSGTTNNYILDLSNTQIQIDVSSYPPGVYGVILVADGLMVDELGLVVN